MKLRSLLKNGIDWFVIILEVTYMVSIIYCILFDNIPVHPYILVIFTVLLCHLFRFGLKISFINLFSRSFIIILFFIILFVDVIQNLLFYTSTMGVAILFNALLFINYLSNLYFEKNQCLDQQIAPYIYYCIYNVLTSLIILSLFFVGISYENNEVAYSVMNSNMIKGNVIYYFPYHLAVASNYHPEMGFPVVSGFSHEPHVIMYVILPSFFFLLGKIQKNTYKYIIYLLFLVMLGQTTSTTAIVFFFFCVFIESIWSYMVKKEKQMLFFVILVILVMSYVLFDYFDLVKQIVTYKLNNEDDSGGTSSAMIKYLFAGGSLVGTGHFPPVYGLDLEKSNYGAGLLLGLLDLCLLVSFMFQSIRLVISNSSKYHYIGMGCLYYILHSLKLGYMIFWYPYMMFMIFILAVTSMQYNKESRKNKLLIKLLNND